MIRTLPHVRSVQQLQHVQHSRFARTRTAAVPGTV